MDACYYGLLSAISLSFRKNQIFSQSWLFKWKLLWHFQCPFTVPFLDLTWIFLTGVPTSPLLLTTVLPFDTGLWLLISSSSGSLFLNILLCSLPSCPIASFSFSSHMVASLAPKVSTVSITVSWLSDSSTSWCLSVVLRTAASHPRGTS